MVPGGATPLVTHAESALVLLHSQAIERVTSQTDCLPAGTLGGHECAQHGEGYAQPAEHHDQPVESREPSVRGRERPLRRVHSVGRPLTGTSEETRRRRADPRARRDGAGAGPRQAYAQRGDPMAGRKRQAGVRGRCAESRVRLARRSSATSEPILGLATYGYSRSRIIPIAQPILCSPVIFWSALRHAPTSHTSIAPRSTRTVVYLPASESISLTSIARVVGATSRR